MSYTHAVDKTLFYCGGRRGVLTSFQQISNCGFLYCCQPAGPWPGQL